MMEYAVERARPMSFSLAVKKGKEMWDMSLDNVRKSKVRFFSTA